MVEGNAIGGGGEGTRGGGEDRSERMRGEEVGKDQVERMSTRERVRRREASGRGGKDREVRGRQRRKHEK